MGIKSDLCYIESGLSILVLIEDIRTQVILNSRVITFIYVLILAEILKLYKQQVFSF